MQNDKLKTAYRTVMRSELGEALKRALGREPKLQMEGDVLSLKSTPEDLDLEDEDMIEVV